MHSDHNGDKSGLGDWGLRRLQRPGPDNGRSLGDAHESLVTELHCVENAILATPGPSSLAPVADGPATPGVALLDLLAREADIFEEVRRRLRRDTLILVVSPGYPCRLAAERPGTALVLSPYLPHDT